jgi:signal recognition particle subunit SEC65
MEDAIYRQILKYRQVPRGLFVGSPERVERCCKPSPRRGLEQGFQNPPDSAKPRTWWHWTGGNVTKDGITKDLEWMKRAGIGGMHLADVSSGSGQTVEKKIAVRNPEWLDAVRHAASEADRLGLEMTIFSSAGWSETGGPWVKPEQAMKKLVWSETAVEGPRSLPGSCRSRPPITAPSAT